MNASVQRLAAEFVVIVVGVLVALAVDQWREDRIERALEVQYAARLISDLRVDTARYGDLLRGPMSNKRDVLFALAEGRAPEADEPARLLRLLDQSTYGGIVETQSAAFREMESSGRIGLLGNSETRDALANYYANHSFLAERYADPPGDYEGLVGAAVPGIARYAYHTRQDVDAELVSFGILRLLSDPLLPPAVNAELAYLGGLVQWHESLRTRATGLIQRLETDYPAGNGSF